MTVLVTGATGFLGSELARQLCEAGERVRVLVRATSDRRRLAAVDVEEVIGDVTDREPVRRGLQGVDRVYHVAALYELGTQQGDHMRRVNVDGTRHVLETAAEHGVAAVHVSSTSAMGPTGKEPVAEDHWAPSPAPSVYAQTKRDGHLVFRELAAAGAPVRAAIPSAIYGPGDDSLLGRMTGLVARGLGIVGIDPGRINSYVHVADCAAGLGAIAERGRDGEEYLVTDDVRGFREWYVLASQAAGRRPPRVWVPFPVVRIAARAGRPVAPLFGVARELIDEGIAMTGDLDYAFSGAKARRELGWDGRGLAEGLVDTMAWYRYGDR